MIQSLGILIYFLVIHYSFRVIEHILQSFLLTLVDRLSEDLYIVECDGECAPVIHLPLLSGFLVVSKVKAQERMEDELS